MRSTHITKPAEVTRKWFVIDAEGQNLGRLSSQIAHILRGKHKPTFSPSVDTGDYVIVVNAEKIKVTGRKLDQKTYVRHSGHLGRRKETKLKDMLNKKPEFVISHAVKGMLPKNNLGRAMLTKFHVYAGPEHKHQAQKPEVFSLS
jgi:large subunit ribosomal protein L13